ncbi:helix-turn-helix domain-containing protein [Myroides fluvii]|uniref:helix-turn-helix domain-containing protein n=1 Tax=Myroides fluvii TaxID=2572594 RepID=UPI00131B83DE|nr:AraC family transcriptional regulator [Myroides fluvii]
MRLTTTIKKVNFKLADHAFFSSSTPLTVSEEQTQVFTDDQYGTIQNTYSIVDPFCINTYTTRTKQVLDIEFVTNQEGVQMLFIMDDAFTYNHHLLRLVPQGTRHFQLPPSDFTMYYISIFIPLDPYMALLQKLNIQYTSPPLQDLDTLENLLHKSQFIKPEMLDIIHIITQCKRKGIFRKFYLQNKIEELLFLQLEQCTYPVPIDIKISKEDREKMHLAKQLITKKLCTPYTLKELAKQIGTNEFKLKTYFKLLFGTTVYGYVTQFKMIQAKQLLLETDLSIAAIADKLGYKTQNHFSTAFKKHFSYSPSEVKNQQVTRKKGGLIPLVSVLLSNFNLVKDCVFFSLILKVFL